MFARHLRHTVTPALRQTWRAPAVRQSPYLSSRSTFQRFFTSEVDKMRNVAIIAHVDHGKTTLVDRLLQQTNTLKGSDKQAERVMDSGDLEKERGITILSKCTSLEFNDHRINVVDTPGHADFGGEVERILTMVDGVVLVVDAAEGPKAQTKFVLKKALSKNLSPVVVINKVDRNEERVEESELEIMELFDELNANESQKEFPVCYASSKNGWAVRDLEKDKRESMAPLLETIISRIPSPKVDLEAPFRFLITLLSNDAHFGRVLTGRIASGRINTGDAVNALNLEGTQVDKGNVLKILANRGLKQETIKEAHAGDIISIAGFPNATVSDTLCAQGVTEPIQADPIDPPTLEISVSVNTSPLAGKEGKKLTASQIGERLYKENKTNVAIDVDTSPDGVRYGIKGRGELQLGVLLETMRREGFEFEISPPRVVFKKDEDGKRLEPIEEVQIEVDSEYSPIVTEKMAARKGDLLDMTDTDDGNRSVMTFTAASRALIGLIKELKNDTKGTAVVNRLLKGYEPYKGQLLPTRNGVLVSTNNGISTAFALNKLTPKGLLFIPRTVDVYEGMIIGETTNSANDLECSPVKAKKMTNIRAAGTDEYIKLPPHRDMQLEEAIAYIQDDELVEVTPKCIRIRKKILNGDARRKEKRNKKSGNA